MAATLTHPAPDIAHVARNLSNLVGRAVTCKPGKPVAPAPKAPVVTATYVEKDGKLAALLIADLPLAACFGAALVLLPPVIVNEAIKLGKLEENLLENLHEVLNVVAGLFNAPNAPRVLLGQVAQGEKLAEPLAAFAKSAPARLDLEVALPGYVGGKLTLVSC